MLANCPAPSVPSLAALQEFRKVDVMKSARMVPVYDSDGTLLAYGERIDVEKSGHLRSMDSLDEIEPDNSIFDSLSIFAGLGSAVAKSAKVDDVDDSPNAVLSSIFPPILGVG